jgi:hypothetical protein
MTIRWPNKSLQATRDGRSSSAVAEDVINPAGLSSGRLGGDHFSSHYIHNILNMKTSVTLIVLLIGVALVGAAHGQGTLIYNSFGPGDTYVTYEGAGVDGPGSGNGLFSSGFSFVPASALTLDTVQVAIATISGTNAFSLLIQAADGPSGIPGTVLETFQVSGQMQPFGFVNPLITVTSVARPELEAGNKYWLVALGEGDALAAWNINNLGLYGTYYSYQGVREVLLDNQLICAFQITGVPEPDSGWIFVLGFAALAVQFLHNRGRTTKPPNMRIGCTTSFTN